MYARLARAAAGYLVSLVDYREGSVWQTERDYDGERSVTALHAGDSFECPRVRLNWFIEFDKSEWFKMSIININLCLKKTESQEKWKKKGLHVN